MLLPPVNRSLLKLLLDLLYHTARNQHINKMSAINLATMFAPQIIWPKNVKTFLIKFILTSKMLQPNYISITFALKSISLFSIHLLQVMASDLQGSIEKLNNGIAFLIRHSQKLFKVSSFKACFSGSRVLLFYNPCTYWKLIATSFLSQTRMLMLVFALLFKYTAKHRWLFLIRFYFWVDNWMHFIWLHIQHITAMWHKCFPIISDLSFQNGRHIHTTHIHPVARLTRNANVVIVKHTELTFQMSVSQLRTF